MKILYKFYMGVWLLYVAALLYPDIERYIFQNELLSLLGLVCSLHYFISNRAVMTRIDIVYLLFLLYGTALFISSLNNIIETGWYLSLRTMPIFYNSLCFIVGLYLYNNFLKYHNWTVGGKQSYLFLGLSLLTPWRLSPQVFAMFFIGSYRYAIGYLALFVLINGGSTSLTALLIVVLFYIFENRSVLARLFTAKLMLMYLLFFLMLMYFSTDLLGRFIDDGYVDVFALDVNFTWRYMFWVYLFQEVISNNPLFGIGFGVPLFDLDVIPGFITTDDGSRNTGFTLGTHNSIVYLLSRMGLVSVLLVGAIHIMVYRKAFVLYKLNKEKSSEILSLILVNLMFLNSMLFNVVLETPLYGGLYWCSLGVLYGAVKKWESTPYG